MVVDCLHRAGKTSTTLTWIAWELGRIQKIVSQKVERLYKQGKQDTCTQAATAKKL